MIISRNGGYLWNIRDGFNIEVCGIVG